MLKQYFRDLPVPLLTMEYGDCFIIGGGKNLTLKNNSTFRLIQFGYYG